MPSALVLTPGASGWFDIWYMLAATDAAVNANPIAAEAPKSAKKIKCDISIFSSLYFPSPKLAIVFNVLAPVLNPAINGFTWLDAQFMLPE